MNNNNYNAISTAVILAAGMGSRLSPLTDDKAKCLVKVNGKTILDSIIESLVRSGYKELVIVTGYKSESIHRHFQDTEHPIQVRFIHNEVYYCTNNIYSLQLALKQLDKAFTLIESDLVFDSDLMDLMKQPDSIALSSFDPTIHNGTVATLSGNHSLEKFYIKESANTDKKLYKTVNIYSFSRKTSALLHQKISTYIRQDRVNCYYEYAIDDLVKSGDLTLKFADFDQGWWDEIDSPEDLKRVEQKIKATDLECAF